MKFDVTLTTILAFIIPGAILVLGSTLVYPIMNDFVAALIKSPSNPGIIFFLATCFIVGTAIDSVRTISTQPLVNWLARKILKITITMDYVSKITDKNLPIFSMLIERTHEYYRLNTNSALSFALLTAMFGICCGVWNFSFWLLLLAVSLAVSISLRARYDTVKAIEKFCQKADAD